MNHQHLFPVVVQEHDFSENEIAAVRTLCQNSPTKEHSLLGGAVSSYFTTSPILDNFIAAPLKKLIQEQLDIFTQHLGLEPVKISNSWFNRMGRGHHVSHHRHEVSIISGALYLEADPGSVGLTLHSPSAPLRMFENLNHNKPLLMNWKEMPCRPGYMVLFPSWLEHSSRTNDTDNRVTLSFNSIYANAAVWPNVLQWSK
jgi:hypothetical protein